MSTLPKDELTIHLPAATDAAVPQDQEYFELQAGGRRRRIRFHDYADIYAVPGLYERLFAETLCCKSPQVVVDLLHQTLLEHQRDPADLRVVDFGAGNGMVGEELARIGTGSIVGLDELEEAKDAAARDRPGIYDSYHALDLIEPEPDVERELQQADFNCLTCVAALGFADIPPDAFQAAVDLISPDGWVAFNIRDRFMTDTDSSGFADVLDDMTSSGELIQHAQLRYPHRLGTNGEPLHYVAVVAQKSDHTVTTPA
jgi:2-polyprenyl-3-methyl-5-hydroxy-6-metoxy-1,4-benzoquinol methylase